LEAGKSALFGYGSLLSIRSLERTLGRKYEGPYPTCRLRGWRRTWDIGMPNQDYYMETANGRIFPRSILYLNIRRDPATVLNGVVFVVDPTDLKNYDERESVYDRVEISSDLEGVRVEGGPAYAYVGQEEYRVAGVEQPDSAAVRATYLQILEDGFADHGSAFRAAYEASSDPVPRHLVIEDRLR